MTKTLYLYEATVEIDKLGRKIMDAFRVDILSGQYLQAYTMMVNHNEALNSPVVKKLINYHAERD
jgi:hypothetical protein